MVRNLNDFREKELIFIDANIFLYHAFNTNDDAISFLQKVESSSYKASTSSLVLEEVFFKLLMQSSSNFMEKVTVEKVKSLLRDDTRREAILRPLAEYRKYIGILRDAGMKVFDLSRGDILAAVGVSRTHHLMVADAAHLAVIKRKNINHLASGDWDFAAVPEITVWSPSPAAKPAPRA
jgi:predicted nucleic acid-binding protein